MVLTMEKRNSFIIIPFTWLYNKYNFQEGNMAVATFCTLHPWTNRMSFPALLEGERDKDGKRKNKTSRRTQSKFLGRGE